MRKMVKSAHKKLILISSVVFLMGIFSCLPVVAGYGTTIGTAETITAGVEVDTLSSVHNSAWYKISCNKRQTLTVVIVTTGSDDLQLIFYNPSQTGVASSFASGITETLSHQCDFSGYYYIEVVRYLPPAADIFFTMTTTLQSSIPGFEILYVFFGIVVLLGIAIYSKNKNRTLIET